MRWTAAAAVQAPWSRAGSRSPRGSQLIGVPFPSGINDRAFTVLLEHDGDESAVVADYAEQAVGLGIDLGDTDSRDLCHEDADGPTCQVNAYDDRGTIFWLFVTETHALLTYDTALFDSRDLDAMPVGDKRPIGVPRTGESFGGGLIYDDFALRVEDGSELASPLTWNGGVTGGFTTVARVIGNADDVFDRYAETAEEEAGEPYRLRRFVWRGMRTRAVNYDEAGGLKINLTMVQTSRDGTWLLINVGND